MFSLQCLNPPVASICQDPLACYIRCVTWRTVAMSRWFQVKHRTRFAMLVMWDNGQSRSIYSKLGNQGVTLMGFRIQINFAGIALIQLILPALASCPRSTKTSERPIFSVVQTTSQLSHLKRWKEPASRKYVCFFLCSFWIGNLTKVSVGTCSLTIQSHLRIFGVWIMDIYGSFWYFYSTIFSGLKKFPQKGDDSSDAPEKLCAGNRQAKQQFVVVGKRMQTLNIKTNRCLEGWAPVFSWLLKGVVLTLMFNGFSSRFSVGHRGQAYHVLVCISGTAEIC